MKSSNKYVVLIAGIVFNLSIGVLYSWSVMKYSLVNDLNWTTSQSTLPYTIAIFVFALGLLIGGRIQDSVGPKKVIATGGLLVGFGMIISSFFIETPALVAVTFGGITGLGIGFGYGAVSPACLKWFHPTQKGLISGLVVGAFGLGAVIFSPLTSSLLESYDVSTTFLILGIGIGIVSFITAQFISNPPEGYEPDNPKGGADQTEVKTIVPSDYTWKEMVKTKQFYLIFIIFTLGSSVGLMIIGNMSNIFIDQVGESAVFTATLMVSLLSIFNAGGRVLSGIISDKIGRVNTLIITALLQGLVMLYFPYIDSIPAIILGSMVIGYSYGSYLSVIPAFTADNYGLKNYGLNYGIIYLSWGFAGVIAPMIAASIGIEKAYVVCAGLSFFVLVIALILKKIGSVEAKA